MQNFAGDGTVTCDGRKKFMREGRIEKRGRVLEMIGQPNMELMTKLGSIDFLMCVSLVID